MIIQLSYTSEQAKQLFESHGLQVITDKVVREAKVHGSQTQEFTTTQLVVVNPTTGESVLLENAMQRLIKRKVMMDLIWSDKMEVLDALNCKVVDVPFKECLSTEISN